MSKPTAKGVLLPLLAAALWLTTVGAIATRAATLTPMAETVKTPTPTPTPKTTVTPTATPTSAGTSTPTPTGSATASSTASTTPTPTGSASASPGGSVTATRTPSASPTPGALTAAALYVANGGYLSILDFPVHSFGDAKPGLIAGLATGLKDPVGIFVDAFKHIFVVNPIADTVIEFPAGTTGNVTPIATIAGKDTGLDFPYDVALDGVGNLYVTNSNPYNTVTEYPPTTNGNVAPIATISGAQTGLAGPAGIVIDKNGVIYVANSSAASITEYAAGSTGDAGPVATIAGSSTGLAGPTGITLDAAGNIYVSNYSGDSVAQFAAGSTGDVAPSAMISGASTGLASPVGVAVDKSGNIYVSNYAGSTVTEYAAGSSGDIAPIVTLSGLTTQLLNPQSLAIASTFPTAPPPPTPTPTPAPRSIFSISPNPIVFPTSGVGAAPITRTLTITNPGAKTSGDVDASDLTATRAFHVRGKGAFTLARGKSKTVQIEFQPLSGGSFAGTIKVTSKSPKSEGEVLVSGVAQLGVLQITPQFIDFGNVPVNTTKTGTFTITNAGLGVLKGTVNVYKLLEGCSVVSGLGAFSLSANGTWKVVVRFAPTSKGTTSGYLIVKSDDPAALSASIDFGGVGA